VSFQEKLRGLTSAVLVTAARLRMLPNLKSLTWAAARDGQRSALYRFREH